MPTNQNSELFAVTKAKELCSYIMTVTQKSPKQFRFTFSSRLQNLSLDVIEDIYYANETFMGKGYGVCKSVKHLPVKNPDIHKL